MRELEVPLFTAVYRNVEQEELTDESYELIDGFVDELGFNCRRPGLSLLLDLGYGTNRPVEGIFWWPEKACALAVSDNKVHQLTYPSSTLTATNITTNGPGIVSTPTFARGTNSNVSTPTYYGLIAAGGAIIQGNGTGSTISNFATLADGDAPTTVSHIDSIDGYILATTNKPFFQNSDVNAPLSWAASSFQTAMRSPDLTKALVVFNRQIYIFGQDSTEVWENDGTPFAPVPGGFFQCGTIAPHSAVTDDNGIYWLGHRRHFMKVEGGQLQSISTPYDKEIADFSTISDCVGFRMEIRGRPAIMWQFPSQQRSLVYQPDNRSWSEWKNWDSNYSEYQPWIGKSYCYSPDWGLHLVGSRYDSKIYSMSTNYKSDNGNEIRFKKVTGLIDHGTNAQKRSGRLFMRAKRGDGHGGSDGVMLLRWNDDNEGWSNQVEVSLGAVGERETVIDVDARGLYRTRQWEIVVTDPVSVVFGKATQELEVL
jgi:hypothetical protein